MTQTKMFYQVIQSPDEGNQWYGEVWSKTSGKDLHHTELVSSRVGAIKAAEAWISDHEGIAHRVISEL